MMLGASLYDIAYWITPGLSLPATLIALAVLTFFSAWYSGIETGLYRFNRLRGQLMVRSGHRPSMALQRYLDNQQLMITMVLVFNNLTHDLAAAVTTYYFAHSGYSSRHAEILATATLTPVLFILAETVPKALFYTHANDLMLHSRRCIAASCAAIRVTGLGWLLQKLMRGALRLTRRFAAHGAFAEDADDLTMMLRESHAEGALSTVQTDIAERILSLPSVRIWRIMMPIRRAVALPKTATRDDFLAALSAQPFTSVPIYEDDRMNVVGVVHTDKLLDNEDRTVAELMEQPLTVPTTASMLEVLTTMQKRHCRIAMIEDRNRRTVGMITIGDLVKYLLG